MAERTLISDMQANQLIEGVYAINNCQLGQTKTGKPYIKCLLSDRSARTPGRMWNATEQIFRALPTDGFVWLQGQTQPYQGEMQVIIQQIKAAEPSADDLTWLLPTSEYDPQEMFEQVTETLDGIIHPPLKALVEAYLADEELMAKFRRAPAATTLHHAYIGGLLEHTLSLLKLADVFCPLYPQLNGDLVRVGLLLHDMGKCEELVWDQGFAYSDEGQLVGHIAAGLLQLQAKADACAAADAPIPAALLMVLKHIIVSHHGKAEFGALKIPATPEAIAVSLLDNLDAKMQMAATAARTTDVSGKDDELGGRFTEKIWALETRLYRPDPTTIED